jgi:hypothetical protein
MANPLRSITVYPTIATVQSDIGPTLPHYILPLDRPALYRFAIGDITTDDDWTALEPTGGTVGRYLDVPEKNLGANLADGTSTIYVGGKKRRRLVASTLTQNSSCTLSATGAREGHELELSLLDSAAWTFALVNGGAGAGTLATKAAGEKRFVRVYFDGANWLLLDSHAIT